MNKSKTPRTDAALLKYDDGIEAKFGGHRIVSNSFARQLETELVETNTLLSIKNDTANVFMEQTRKLQDELAASRAREAQYRDALNRIPEDKELPASTWKAIIASLNFPPPPVVPLSLAESLAKALDSIAKWNLPKHYELDYGSSGVRDYIKGVAERALEAWRAAK